MLNDFARLNRCGEIAIFVHSSLSLKRLDLTQFMQKSTVYESMFLEIYNNACKQARQTRPNSGGVAEGHPRLDKGGVAIIFYFLRVKNTTF